ncbi:hypothetical protein ACFLWR_04710 [Chloroflexota bacterium]
MEETITHRICYIPDIRIEVSKEWLLELRKTGNVENREKRKLLTVAIKRWVYLSWILRVEPKGIEEAYQRTGLWDEIVWIKNSVIPEIISPNKIAYITPQMTLETGRLVQFGEKNKPTKLDFSTEIPPKPSSESFS